MIKSNCELPIGPVPAGLPVPTGSRSRSALTRVLTNPTAAPTAADGPDERLPDFVPFADESRTHAPLARALAHVYESAPAAQPAAGTDAVAATTVPAADNPDASPQPAPFRPADRRRERDRRAFPRRDSGCLVAIRRISADGPLNPQQMAWLLHSSSERGAVADISMNGIAFNTAVPFEPGERLLMRLTNRRFGRHVDTTARVLRALPTGGPETRIVCHFERNLTFEQVRDLGQHLFVSQIV